jgi:hydrogenase expression/formation protein HypC
MEIVKIKDNIGVARAEGLEREVNIQFLKNVKKGDFVIIHAGFAIEKIDRKKARETLDLYKEMGI